MDEEQAEDQESEKATEKAPYKDEAAPVAPWQMREKQSLQLPCPGRRRWHPPPQTQMQHSTLLPEPLRTMPTGSLSTPNAKKAGPCGGRVRCGLALGEGTVHACVESLWTGVAWRGMAGQGVAGQGVAGQGGEGFAPPHRHPARHRHRPATAFRPAGCGLLCARAEWEITSSQSVTHSRSLCVSLSESTLRVHPPSPAAQLPPS